MPNRSDIDDLKSKALSRYYASTYANALQKLQEITNGERVDPTFIKMVHEGQRTLYAVPKDEESLDAMIKLRKIKQAAAEENLKDRPRSATSKKIDSLANMNRNDQIRISTSGKIIADSKKSNPLAVSKALENVAKARGVTGLRVVETTNNMGNTVAAKIKTSTKERHMKAKATRKLYIDNKGDYYYFEPVCGHDASKAIMTTYMLVPVEAESALEGVNSYKIESAKSYRNMNPSMKQAIEQNRKDMKDVAGNVVGHLLLGPGSYQIGNCTKYVKKAKWQPIYLKENGNRSVLYANVHKCKAPAGMTTTLKKKLHTTEGELIETYTKQYKEITVPINLNSLIRDNPQMLNESSLIQYFAGSNGIIRQTQAGRFVNMNTGAPQVNDFSAIGTFNGNGVHFNQHARHSKPVRSEVF